MNETFDSAAEKFSPGNHPGDRDQNEVASAMGSWKERLKDNLFIVLTASVAISFLVGYFISQQQEARKRDQWAEILFRQAKHWLTDRGKKTADSIKNRANELTGGQKSNPGCSTASGSIWKPRLT